MSVPFTPHSFQYKLSSVIFDLGHSYWYKMESQSCFGLPLLMAKDVEHFLKCLSGILDSSVASSLIRSILNFFLRWIICSFDDHFF